MEDNVEITLNIRPLGGKQFTLQVAPQLTVLDLRNTITDKVGGGHVRLLHKGRQLTEGTIAEAGLTANSSIAVIRSSEESVKAVRSLREDKLLRGIATKTKARYTAMPKPSAKRPSLFGDTRASPEFANWQDALEILDELATHPGFYAAMKKRNWTVGLLAEMVPQGRIGVDPVCVLGYNVNKGMEIHLRLRTDDGLGFRPMYKLYEVLAHELAHNEHSDHGEEFKQLMLDVQREAEEGDWRYSTGRVLGHGGYIRNNVPGSRRRLAEVRIPQPQRRGASAARSRLVREHEQRRRIRNDTPAEKSNENQQPETKSNRMDTDCCGKSHNQPNEHNHQHKGKTTVTKRIEQPKISDEGETSMPTVAANTPPVHAVTVSQAPPSRPDSQQLTTLIGMGVERQLAIIALRMCKNEVTAALDYALSPPALQFGTLTSTSPLASNLRSLLDLLCTETANLDDHLRTLQLIHTYLNNVVQSPGNPRYRNINAANATFSSLVSCYPSAVEYLANSGFSFDSGASRWSVQDKTSVHILSANIVLERMLSLVGILT